MKISTRIRAIIAASLLSGDNLHAGVQVNGVTQLSLISTEDETSFVYGGTGRTLYENSDLEITQALSQIRLDITDSISSTAVINQTYVPEDRTGVTQFFVDYEPIPKGPYKWRLKTGLFYPALSFENVDIGWLSPFTYTNSAINTWIGEELRAAGTELTIERPGKHFSSQHDYVFSLGAYKGNDPTGTLLAWRGFSMHDKQTQLNELIPFANYPIIDEGGMIEVQDAWVDPFREIDGRWGFYSGFHWGYTQKSKLRYYYYDNRADPLAVVGGQYAWRTKFHSLAWQYRTGPKLRLIFHYLNGSTLMGPNAVNVNFQASYFLASYKVNRKHRISMRIDSFGTSDNNDILPEDDNGSHGMATTLAWRYNFATSWQLGGEALVIDSSQSTRTALDLPRELDQSQIMGVLEYRF